MALRRRIVTRGAKRQTTWFQFVPTEVTMTATGGTIIFSLNAAALAMRPFTVVRSHFELMLRSDQAAAIEQQSAGFGIAVVSDEATAAGVASVPTPVTEMGSHLWFVHSVMFGQASTVTDRAEPVQVKSIDSKAMRRVEVGSDIVVVGEKGSVGGGLVLSVAGRMLVKNN